MWERLAVGAFLDAQRVRGWLTIAAGATVLMVVFGLATSHGLLDMTGRPLGTDFISFWTAARVAIAGPIDDAWDMVRHGSEQAAIFGPSDTFAAFFYPPVYLFVVWPLGYLPYLTALAVWVGGTALLCRQTLVAWAGPWAKGWVGLIAFIGFPAFFSALGHGQNSFLTTAIFAGGGLLLGRRPVLAGVVLGCLVYKPHMAAALPIALAAAGYWRAFFSMGATAVGLMGLSYAVFGASSWQAFIDLSPAVKMTLESGLVEPGKMVSVYRAVRMMGFESDPAWLAHGMVVAVVLTTLAILAWRHRAPEGVIAAAAAATLLISPYMLDYDEMLLAVPMTWMVRRGLEGGFLRWERVGILAAFMLPGFARPIGMALEVPVAPLVSLLFMGLVMGRVTVDHLMTGAPSSSPKTEPGNDEVRPRGAGEAASPDVGADALPEPA